MRKNDLYYMIADKQLNFSFDSINDVSIEKLFWDITDYLANLFERYESQLGYSCDSILMDL